MKHRFVANKTFCYDWEVMTYVCVSRWVSVWNMNTFNLQRLSLKYCMNHIWIDEARYHIRVFCVTISIAKYSMGWVDWTNIHLWENMVLHWTSEALLFIQFPVLQQIHIQSWYWHWSALNYADSNICNPMRGLSDPHSYVTFMDKVLTPFHWTKQAG